jgi:homoserine kinase
VTGEGRAPAEDRSVRISAPASTANLGAGFDALALALDLRNELEIEVLDGPAGRVDLTVEGEGAGRLTGRRGNRLLASVRAGLDACGVSHARWSYRVSMRNRIPLARGLGSSAAATVSGLLAARVLAGSRGSALSDTRMLELGAELEGHPDNFAAALHGGFVVVARVDGRLRAVRFDVPADLVCALFIPERPLSTAAMRAALPANVPLTDAVHNVGAASLAVAAFATGDLSLLRAATEDRLHEPYRAAAVYPEMPALVEAARAGGALGACLSGSGSSVIAFAASEPAAGRAGEAMARAAEVAGLRGRSRIVRPSSRGAGAW